MYRQYVSHSVYIKWPHKREKAAKKAYKYLSNLTLLRRGFIEDKVTGGGGQIDPPFKIMISSWN